LTEGEVFYSNGCCPYCGKTNRGTVIDVRKQVVEVEADPHEFLRGISIGLAIVGGVIGLAIIII
jgi:hypothetical protein